MKKITFILLALISGTAFGQTDVTANANATIITALKIEKVTGAGNLEFGIIAPKADVGSTFTVNNAGSASGDATDLVATDHKAASFTITGDSNQNFILTVTPPTNITGAGGDPIPFTVDSSLTDGSNPLTGGSATLNIGGTLTLAANQGAGSYTGEISIKVAYE